VVKEREKNIALFNPVPNEEELERKLEMAAMKGLVHLPEKKGRFSTRKKVHVDGKPLSDIIPDMGDGKW